MTHSPSTIIYGPSEIGAVYVATAFSPEGRIEGRQSFDTREAVEAFLQAFMQVKAGPYGLMSTPQGAESGGELQERRTAVIKSAKDETKRRHLGVHGKKSK
jgi:hypothetical protein